MTGRKRVLVYGLVVFGLLALALALPSLLRRENPFMTLVLSATLRSENLLRHVLSAKDMPPFILSTSKGPCKAKYLPFPAMCITGCPSVYRRFGCLEKGLKLAKKAGYKVAILADVDLMFARWSKEQFEEEWRAFDSETVFSVERHMLSGSLTGEVDWWGSQKEDVYVNAGVMLGEIDRLMEMAEASARRVNAFYSGTLNQMVPDEYAKKLLMSENRTMNDQGMMNQWVNDRYGKIAKCDVERRISYSLADIFSLPYMVTGDSYGNSTRCHQAFRSAELREIGRTERLGSTKFVHSKYNLRRAHHCWEHHISFSTEDCHFSVGPLDDDPWLNSTFQPFIIHWNGGYFKQEKYNIGQEVLEKQLRFCGEGTYSWQQFHHKGKFSGYQFH